MILFDHRRNTIEQLRQTAGNYGVEIDLRTRGNDLILHHDPFVEGILFSDWIQSYHHAGLILNVKEEGLEARLINTMKEHGIENYFFLDLSIPFLVKTINNGCHKVAVRFSEYEPLEFVRKFEGYADWVWVDCFTENVLDKESYNYLKQHFKICIVSPELQAHPIEWIDTFKTAYKDFEIDAVCTKRPELWK